MIDDRVRVSPLPDRFTTMVAGPGLAVAAASVDRDACNGYELEVLIQARRKLIAHLEAACLADMAALAYCPPGPADAAAERTPELRPHGPAVLEPLLGWTAYHADWYLDLALVLETLPRTRQALAAGELELPDARAIAERIRVLDTPAERRAVEDALFPDVLHLRAGLLRIRVEAEIIKVNPEAALRRHRQARAGRGVDMYPAIDGVADLHLHGIPADQAAEAYAYLDAIARSMKSAGDNRTLPQLRADIAASLLSGRADVTPCSGGAFTGQENGSDEPTGSATEADTTHTDLDAADGTARGCPHTGCDHEHHDRYCPCPDCKPARRGIDKTSHYGSAQDSPDGDGADRDGAARDSSDTGRRSEESGGCEGGPQTGEGPGGVVRAPRVRTRAKIHLTIPLLALLGLSRQPAELGGFGPILDETARRIMANHLDNPDAMFTVGVTHPITGRLLSLHPIPRRFLRGLAAELVEVLNQRCVWMTCRRSANACQLDHTTDHADGGQTSVDNSGPLCPRHHTVKTEAEWTVRQPTPGDFAFTDPYGRTYNVTAPRLTDPYPAIGEDLASDRPLVNDPEIPPF